MSRINARIPQHQQTTPEQAAARAAELLHAAETLAHETSRIVAATLPMVPEESRDARTAASAAAHLTRNLEQVQHLTSAAAGRVPACLDQAARNIDNMRIVSNNAYMLCADVMNGIKKDLDNAYNALFATSPAEEPEPMSKPTIYDFDAYYDILMTFAHIGARSDGLMADMPAGSKHYKVSLIRYNGDQMDVLYSQGAASTQPPTLAEIMRSLISDYGFYEYDFSEFCNELGFEPYTEDDEGAMIENPIARRVYDAVQVQSAALLRMFTEEEIADLARILDNE